MSGSTTSSTLAVTQITDVGNNLIISNGGTAAGISISYAGIGSDNISTYTTTQLQDMTAVSSLVYSTTSNTSALQYLENTGSPNQVIFKLTLDETVGNFSVGNIGLYNTDNDLFSITALTSNETKVATAAGLPGNSRVYNIILNFSNAESVADVTIIDQSASALPEVSTQVQLPTASSAPYNVYLVDQHTEYNMPCLAARYGNDWYYIMLEDDYPQANGSIFLPGMFNTAVSAGDAVCFNAGTFALASGASPTTYPIGVRGEGDYLYPPGSIFTNPSGSYSANAQYYCGNTAATGNVITSGNTILPVALGLDSQSIYVNIQPANMTVVGGFTVINQSGSTVASAIPTSAAMSFPGGVSAASGVFSGNVTVNYNGAGSADHFASGTEMVFYQATAPTGWVQRTDLNDYVLRVVSGAGGAGSGSWYLSGMIVGNTALSVDQMAYHTHSVYDPGHNHTFLSYAENIQTGGNVNGWTGGNNPEENGVSVSGTNISIYAAGGGQPHTHTFSNDASWRPQNLAVIIAYKNF